MECMKFQMFTLPQQTNNKSGLVGQWFFKVKSKWRLQTLVRPVWRPAFDPKSLSRCIGQVWRTSQQLQTKLVELSRTSHEPTWLNWVRLMWSTAFDPGLTDKFCFIPFADLLMKHVTFFLCANFLAKEFLQSSVSIFYRRYYSTLVLCNTCTKSLFLSVS